MEDIHIKTSDKFEKLTTFTDLIAAISKVLTDETGYKIVADKDIKEKIIRPSFKVELQNPNVEKIAVRTFKRNCTISIRFFSKERYNNEIENLEMQEQLTLLFTDLNLKFGTKNFTLNIDSDINFDIVDDVLVADFDIEYYEDYTIIDDKEMLEELEINLVQEKN